MCVCVYSQVEEVEADAVVALADDVVAEGGRVPAVARLLVVRLFAERLLAQAVPGRRLRAAVDGVVGVGGGVERVVISVRAAGLLQAAGRQRRGGEGGERGEVGGEGCVPVPYLFCSSFMAGLR